MSYPSKCPHCNADVSEFQTKDGPLDMREVPVCNVRRFYTGCPKCGKWIEYEVEPPKTCVIKLVNPVKEK